MALAAVGLGSRDARCDEVQACATAYEQAQVQRRKGQLNAARKSLIHCVRDVCPAFLRQDCSQWLNEVERAVPSIVVEARDSAGQDRPDATITIDGVTVQLTDGKSVTLDPGPHSLHVEAPGLTPAALQIVVREGDQRRRIGVTLVRPTTRPVPALSWVLAGAGVVAIGVGAGFGIRGLSDRAALDDRQCKPSCPSSEVDSIRTSYWVADVSLGVGAIALGAALWLYVARPHKSEAPRTERAGLSLRPSAGGGSVAFVF